MNMQVKEKTEYITRVASHFLNVYSTFTRTSSSSVSWYYSEDTDKVEILVTLPNETFTEVIPFNTFNFTYQTSPSEYVYELTKRIIKRMQIQASCPVPYSKDVDVSLN